MREENLRRRFIKFRKNLLFTMTMGGLFVYILNFNLALAKESESESKNVEGTIDFSDPENGYTINFNNIAIVEYIKFVSKITSVNFVFDEQDLQFNVTIVSEEPISAKNIMSALIQILRIHGLTLLEQENNLLVTRSTTVAQVPTIISSEMTDKEAENAPIVTRIFRIKNANPTTLASIIRPMISASALLELSNETRQLIITDITTNVDKIAVLLATLDSPHTALEVETYVAKNITSSELITLVTQIITPFAEGNPLIFVPHVDTNTIYIVSTPHLIERAMMVMEDLDIPVKSAPITIENIFIYKILHRDSQDLLNGLRTITKQLKDSPAPPIKLISAIDSAKILRDVNSLFFIGDNDSIVKLKEILTTLDTTTSESVEEIGKTTFFIYKIQNSSEEMIQDSLKQLTESLEDAGLSDHPLIRAINTMKWLKETNSIVFTGSDVALKQLQQLLPTLDVSPSQSKAILSQLPPSNNFLIYSPKYKNGEELQDEIDDVGKNLKASGLADPALLRTIDTMKWLSSTNTLLFTGDQASLDEIQRILKGVDISTAMAGTEVLLYKPKYISKSQLQDALSRLAENLDSNNPQDQKLANAIDSMKWMSDSQSFLFKADPATIERLKSILTTMDNPEGLTGEGVYGFYLYKLQYAQGEVVLKDLKNVSANLPSEEVSHRSIIKTIDNIKWFKENNSLLITGTPNAIEKVKTLIAEFDIPGAAPAGAGAGEKSSFFIYKPQYQSADFILSYLKNMAVDLENSGLIDPNLLPTLTTARLVTATNSLLFTGTPDSLEKVKGLLKTIDVQALGGPAIQQLGNLTFLIYKLQYVSSAQFMSSLKSFASELNKTNALDAQLKQTIDTMKWIKETNSILFTGTSQVLERVEELAKKFDTTSLAEVRKGVALTYVLYTPKYQTGDCLISILCNFEQNLAQSGVVDQGVFDTINNLKWMEETSTLLISGDEESIKKVEGLLQKFDLPSKAQEGSVPSIETLENTSFLVYKLQYHQGGDILNALKQVSGELTKGTSQSSQNLITAINSLQWITVTNSLLATGEQEVLTKLKDLIQNLDVPLRQVFIEVLIIETTLSNLQSFGVQWGGQAKYMNKVAASTGNFPAANPFSGFPTNGGIQTPLTQINATRFPNPNTDIPFAQGFDFGAIGDIIMNKGRSFISLGALVNALQSDADTTVVLNPKIIAQDNKNSTIFVGQNVPYIGSNLFVQGGVNTSTTSNIEYRDIGLNLSITPILGNGDVVTLQISNDITSQIQATAGQNIPQNGILTTHTSLSASVHVPNDHFVVLSGLIHDTKQHFTSSIPCLGGLPVIGAVFSTNDRGDAKDNLVFFIRPHIINSFDEYKQLTEHQENLYKDEATLPILKEEFDDAINIVKQPEDE